MWREDLHASGASGHRTPFIPGKPGHLRSAHSTEWGVKQLTREVIDADNQLGVTGQKALCFLSTGICARFIWRDTGSNDPGGGIGVQKWMKAIIGLWGPRVGVCSLEGWETSLKAALVQIPYGKVFGRCCRCSSGCVGYGSQGSAFSGPWGCLS